MNNTPQGGGLKEALLRRAAFTSPPPQPKRSVPPAEKRWATANAMQQAYANNWTPNPMLIQAMMHDYGKT